MILDCFRLVTAHCGGSLDGERRDLTSMKAMRVRGESFFEAMMSISPLRRR